MSQSSGRRRKAERVREPAQVVHLQRASRRTRPLPPQSTMASSGARSMPQGAQAAAATWRQQAPGVPDVAAVAAWPGRDTPPPPLAVAG
ncbi:Os11g0552450 [Oryza sativa Japonica Group]|uniref:Os11g0552450 protein n=1 Tax=Oryza sativa subsp. japonica TaxID=39947 RepID=A0A0P0Y3S8_ORYSJ|nr:Os11g0552450 [Oryza sativa Japonica Group]